MKGKQASRNHRSDRGGQIGIGAGRWSGKCLIELFHYAEVYGPLAESKIFVSEQPFFSSSRNMAFADETPTRGHSAPLPPVGPRRGRRMDPRRPCRGRGAWGVRKPPSQSTCCPQVGTSPGRPLPPYSPWVTSRGRPDAWGSPSAASESRNLWLVR